MTTRKMQKEGDKGKKKRKGEEKEKEEVKGLLIFV